MKTYTGVWEIMSESDFKKFLEKLEYKDGKILYNGVRLLIIPSLWLGQIQKNMENILGPEGTYVVIQNSSEEAGKILGTKVFGAFPEDMNLKDKIKEYIYSLELRGWGNIIEYDFQEDPLKITIKVKDAYITDAYHGDATDSKCYYITSVVSLIANWYEQHGISKNLHVEEIMCEAKGDPYNVYVISEK